MMNRRLFTHYECNIILSEAMYPTLSIMEVLLRNALSRQLSLFMGRTDWYVSVANVPGLADLNKPISQAQKMISGRGETITPSKVTAELTLGFWTTLLNRNYELILWKDLRKAFPYMPKEQRQRKKIAAYLNRFRHLRNRVDHNEAICWNLQKVTDIHSDLLKVMGWIDKDIPSWVNHLDRFNIVVNEIKIRLNIQ